MNLMDCIKLRPMYGVVLHAVDEGHVLVRVIRRRVEDAYLNTCMYIGTSRNSLTIQAMKLFSQDLYYETKDVDLATLE